MSTILLVHLANLSEANQNEFLSRSDVGIAKWVQSGEVTLYHRIRNISTADIDAMGLSRWEFPVQGTEEDTPSYVGRLRAEITSVFNQLKTGAKDCAFISEAGYQLLSQQPEFTAL